MAKSTVPGTFCERLNTFDDFSTQGRRKSLQKVVEKTSGGKKLKCFGLVAFYRFLRCESRKPGGRAPGALKWAESKIGGQIMIIGPLLAL